MGANKAVPARGRLQRWLAASVFIGAACTFGPADTGPVPLPQDASFEGARDGGPSPMDAAFDDAEVNPDGGAGDAVGLRFATPIRQVRTAVCSAPLRLALSPARSAEAMLGGPVRFYSDSNCLTAVDRVRFGPGPGDTVFADFHVLATATATVQVEILEDENTALAARQVVRHEACPNQCGACGPAECCGDRCAGADCRLSCASTACPCHLDCGATEGTCELTCGPDQVCFFDCAETNNCFVRCDGVGSVCETRCENADNCDQFRCTDDAACLVYCNGAENCRFVECPNGAVDCGNGILVCNRDCPP